MREIKFRAWHKERKGWAFIGWGPYDLSCHSDTGVVNLGDWEDVASVDDLDFQLYVGIEDNRGKDIYDGDIVLDCNGDFCEVHWGASGFQFIVRSHDETRRRNRIRHKFGDFEVIGNIYENSELLKEREK